MTLWGKVQRHFACGRYEDPLQGVLRIPIVLAVLFGREINAMFRHRVVTALFAVAAAFVLFTANAYARPLGGFSAGSRGMRTYSAPPSTGTAPTAAPIQRSLTQPSNLGLARSMPSSSLFGGRGLLGGLAAGFLGAGLFGLLFGYGLFGGMAGFASIFGLLLQVLLITVVARLVFAWWQRRNLAAAPAYAAPNPAASHNFGGFSGILNSAPSQPSSEPLTIANSDYSVFERLLGDIQTAYSAEDLSAMRAMVTPEMLSYFSEELAANASRGLVNRVTDVKLLQGDLAEAWREGRSDYATVAMKFALRDSMAERASGRTVEGGEQSEVTELWTFVRAQGGNWLLSAIQQS
jgi:predicted lipid-binding transport protein (Tim44 family)